MCLEVYSIYNNTKNYVEKIIIKMLTLQHTKITDTSDTEEGRHE